MPTNPLDPELLAFLGFPAAPVAPAPAPVESDCDDSEVCESCGNNPDDCTLCHGCSECADLSEACDGNDYCESCTDERFFSCADCSDQTEIDRYSRYENSSRERICEGCAENYCGCDSCGRTIHNEDSIYRSSRDSTYCESCDPGNDEYAEFDAVPFPMHVSHTYGKIGSTRTFGVELETARCADHVDLEDSVHFGAYTDGSIDGMEFVSAVLKGDKGLDAVTDFCNRANSMGFKVDSACGYHLHIGCQDLSDGQLYAVSAAYALLADVFQSFVPTARRRNTYCGSTDWTAQDALNAWNDDERFAYFADRDRYQWLNLAAYNEHKTLEVRLHTATLNPVKVNNWIMLHTRFVDSVAMLSIGEVMRRFGDGSPAERFARLATIIGPELAVYYRERAREFGTDYNARASKLIPAVA